jgi:GNAT superfamily N-acetyltransferase
MVIEYLDDVAAFDQCYASVPELVLTARIGRRVIGVSYGSRASASEVVLQGIAVTAAWSGRGVGSRLLSAWEGCVASHGYDEVSVGSAEGYVEHFYAKNGYRPTGYLVRVPADRPFPRGRFQITRVSQAGDARLVNLASTQGSSALAKAAVVAAFGATQINVIFTKDLRPVGSPS